MSVWWSVGLAAVGIAGLWLAGASRTRAIGWALGLAAQPAWIAFAIVGRQWGFVATGLVYGIVYARNLDRERRPKQGFASPDWDKTEDDPRHPVQRGTFGYAKDDDSNTWRPIVLADDGQLYTASVVQMWADSGRGEVAEGERVTFRPIPTTVHQACAGPRHLAYSPLLAAAGRILSPGSCPDELEHRCVYCSDSGGKACRLHPAPLEGS